MDVDRLNGGRQSSYHESDRAMITDETITTEIESQNYAPHLVPELPMPKEDEATLAKLVAELRAKTAIIDGEGDNHQTLNKYRRDIKAAQRAAIRLMWTYQRQRMIVGGHEVRIETRRDRNGEALPPTLKY